MTDMVKMTLYITVRAMKGDAKVIEYLNQILKNELTAINQYFLHSKMLKNWGFHQIGDFEYKEAIDEMKHADILIERTLFLEGLPNLSDLNSLRIGENVPEIFKYDLELEYDAHKDLKAAIVHCESVSDFASRDLFKNILQNEEDHIDWLETQLEVIDKIGIENYLQSKQ